MAYSYHDWTTSPVNSPLESSSKKKSGVLKGIKKFFTKSERPAAGNKVVRKAASNPDIADNYNRQFGQSIVPASHSIAPELDPNSFFSDNGMVNPFPARRSPIAPKKKLPQSSSPAFEIPEYHRQARPSLENVFDIHSKRDNSASSSRVSRNRKQELPSASSSKYESPRDLLGGGPSGITRHHSSDWKSKEEGRHERRGRRYDRRPSLTDTNTSVVSVASSERSVERSERRRGSGGIKVIGPKSIQPKPKKDPMHPDPHYMMQMPPYGTPYNEGPYDEGPYDTGPYNQGPYGQEDYSRYPAPVMMYPQYGGYGMPNPYMNFFPPVPEETGTENMAHKHGNKPAEKKQRKRHKSKESTPHKDKDSNTTKAASPAADEQKDENSGPHGFDDFALY